MESSGMNGVRGPEVNHQGYPYQGYPQPYPAKQPPGDPNLRPGIPHNNSFPPHLRPGGPPGPPGQGQWGLPPRAPSPYGSQPNPQHPGYGYRPPPPQQVPNNMRPGYPEQYPQYRYPPSSHGNNAPSPISSPGPQMPPSHPMENHQHSQPPSNGTGPGGHLGEQGPSSDTASPGPTHAPAPSAKRPSPSPTGSSGSASSQPMSPAIGNVMPTRPSSRQDLPPQHGQQPNHGPPPQGNYGQGPMPPPHLGSYPPGKPMPGYHPHGQHYSPGPQQGPPSGYSPQRPQGPGQYGNYPPQQQGVGGTPVSQPYGGSAPPRPGPPGQYGQYPGYPPNQYPHQQWGGKPGVGQPSIQQPPASRPPAPAQPVQYLRHQLQQKVGYPNQGHGGNPALTPPHPGYQTSGGNLLSPQPQPPPSPGPNVGPAQVTVTGPDGAGIDEASQQSTLSNASQASGDDGPPTPRSRAVLGVGGFPGSHPATPSSGTVPSPGMIHDDYADANSPGAGWGRPSASPRLTISEGIQRLYDFDDHPERRPFVEQLLRFMEEEGHPITSCPSISKNPLDLFRLYILVRERGGFIEVTKNKTWKDIAGLLGIGASSSAAYTLRKHYTRNLLRWECRFDRGGIDPNPIILQYESASGKKKKNAEQAAALAPAPLDGYPGQPMGHPGPMPGPPGQHPSSHPGHPGPPHQGYGGYPHPGPPHGGEYHGHPPPGQHGVHHGPPRGPPMALASGGAAPAQSYPRPPGPGGPPGNYGPGFGPAGHGPRPPHPQGLGAQPGQFASYGNDQAYKVPVPTTAPGPQEYPPAPNAQSQYPPPPSSFTLPTKTLYPPFGAAGSQAAPSPDQVGAPHQPVAPQPQPGLSDQPGFRYPTPVPGAMPPYQQLHPNASPAPSPSPGLGPPRTMSPSPSTPGPSQSPAPIPHPMPSQHAGPVPGHPGGSEMNGPTGDMYQRGGLRQLLSTPANQSQQSMQVPTQSLSDRLQGYPHAGSPKPISQAPRPSLTPMQPMMPPSGAAQSSPMAQQPYQQYGQQPRPQAMNWRPPMQGQGGPPQQYGPGGPGATGPQSQAAHWAATHQRPSGSAGPAPHWDQQYQPRPGQPGPPQQGQPPAWAMQSNQGLRPMAQQRPPFRPEQGVKGHYGPMSQQGPAPRGPVPPQVMSSQFGRREIVFPPDSVEATQPILVKKRRLVKQDVAPVEGWRLMMALKSGLLAESTWALDVLNVLLYDDHSVVFFGLGNLPGLLDTLLDYARVYLHSIFGLFSDLDSSQDEKKISDRAWWQPREPETGDNIDFGEVRSEDLKGGKLSLLQCNPDSRLAQPLKFEDVKSMMVSSRRRNWDKFDTNEFSPEELRSIITHVECDVNYARFVRVTADVKKVPEPVVVVKQEIIEPEIAQPEDLKLPPKKAKNNVKKGKSLEDILARIKKEPVSAPVPPTPTEPIVQTNGLVNGFSDIESKPEIVPPSEPKPEVKVDTDCDIDVYGEKLVVRDPTGNFKRKAEVLEDECQWWDEPCLTVQSVGQETLSKRCVTILNILRSLTFVPGNERELVQHAGFLKLVGRLLLLNHHHAPKPCGQRHYDKEDEIETPESSSALGNKQDWWSEVLLHSREAALVILANISGYLDLNQFNEDVSRPIIDGLLHWATCNSAQAQDPFPWIGSGSSSLLSPQRLALETLCKLCVLDSNPELILSTPPLGRIETLCGLLSKWLCRSEDQVRRELALNLIYYFSAASESVAWLIASQSATFTQLLSFIEQAEGNAMTIASQHGINALRDNPDAMGTSLDMLRRAASSVVNLSKHELARPLLARHELRLVNLVMSQILDQGVASLLSQALFACSDIPEESADDAS